MPKVSITKSQCWVSLMRALKKLLGLNPTFVEDCKQRTSADPPCQLPTFRYRMPTAWHATCCQTIPAAAPGRPRLLAGIAWFAQMMLSFIVKYRDRVWRLQTLLTQSRHVVVSTLETAKSNKIATNPIAWYRFLRPRWWQPLLLILGLPPCSFLLQLLQAPPQARVVRAQAAMAKRLLVLWTKRRTKRDPSVDRLEITEVWIIRLYYVNDLNYWSNLLRSTVPESTIDQYISTPHARELHRYFGANFGKLLISFHRVLKLVWCTQQRIKTTTKRCDYHRRSQVVSGIICTLKGLYATAVASLQRRTQLRGWKNWSGTQEKFPNSIFLRWNVWKGLVHNSIMYNNFNNFLLLVINNGMILVIFRVT